MYPAKRLGGYLNPEKHDERSRGERRGRERGKEERIGVER